jgi:endo-1,4-beta-mannosidase
MTSNYSQMRGANYVPSYARNTVHLWMDFDAEVVDRELGYAEKLGLNTVRVFLQCAVYEHSPQRFLAAFESFLAISSKHNLKVIPALFDACVAGPPEIDCYRERDWMAGPGSASYGAEHWPALEKYVADVVGSHLSDDRVLMWDVMNAPYVFARTEEARVSVRLFVNHFIDQVRALHPSQPITSGVEHSTIIPDFADRLDVFCFHNYKDPDGLRAEIRSAKAMAEAHGKPVFLAEFVMRPYQPFAEAMRIVREEDIGWCFWELMRGSNPWNRGDNPAQGLLLPDGACPDEDELEAVTSKATGW